VALVLLLVFAESAIFLDLLVPGEVGLVVAGAAAAQNDTPLAAVALAAAVGAVAGDSVGYLLGRRFGDHLVDRWEWTRKHLGPGLRKAEDHYTSHGGWSVAVARWVGALRAVVPVVAGSADMPAGRFYAWGAPAALAWAITISSVGFVWGDDVSRFVDDIGLVVSGVVVAAVLAVLWWRRWRRPRPPATPAP